MQRLPLSRAACPICGSDGSTSRPIGQLTVCTCDSCGHGWQTHLLADNTHFEGADYQEWRRKVANVITRRGQEYVDDLIATTGTVPGTAMEIGCATGETIGALSAKGTMCWGADTSSAAISAAVARYPAVQFIAATMPKPDRPIDATLMMHVIEHVPDPVATLARTRELAASNGILYVRTPNYGGAAARTLRGAWPDYMADHVHYFTKRSLAVAFANAGWHIVDARTAAHSWPWIGGAKRLVTRSHPTRQASDHNPPPDQRRMRVLGAADRLMGPLLWAEARSGLGNEMVVVARADKGSVEVT